MLSLIVGFRTLPLHAVGIEITNGRPAMTSVAIFLSDAQQQEAKREKRVTLTADQQAYLGEAALLARIYAPMTIEQRSKIDPATHRNLITNLTVLTVAEAKRVDASKLLNVCIWVTNEMVDVPVHFLGRNLAERDKLRGAKFFSETSSSDWDDTIAETRKMFWFELRYKGITGLLCSYYAQHPERFKPTGNDEEIVIEGFADFVSKEPIFTPEVGGYQIHKGTIYDPWGEPLHFVQDRNRDGKIKARGFEHIVFTEIDYPFWGPLNDKERLGICKHSVKGLEDQPHACIFVETYIESEAAKARRLKATPPDK